MGLHYLLILIICLSLIYYKYEEILSNTVEEFSDFKELNPYVGYKLNMPIKKQIIMGGEFHMFSYKKISDIISYNFNLKLVNNNSIDTLNNLNNNKLNIALVSEDIFIDAIQGSNKFTNPQTNLRFVTGFCNELYYLILPDNSQINDIESIKKSQKKIKIGTSTINTISDITLKKLLSVYEVKNIDISNHELNDLFNLFYTGELDCIFVVTGIFDPLIINIVNLKSVKFIKFNNNSLINKTFGQITRRNIDINNYKLRSINTKDSIEDKEKYTGLTETYSNRIVLVSNKNTSINDIYDITKFIIENHLIIRNSLSTINGSTQNFEYKSNSYYNDFKPITMAYINKKILIHPGSKKYYREVGFITNNPSYKCYEKVGISSCDKDKGIDKKKYYWKHDEIGLKNFKL